MIAVDHEIEYVNHEIEYVDHEIEYMRILLMGPAGCGKSTRLPKMLPEEDENHCVAVGEPRARQLANRVAEQQGESVGCKVGLFTGHERTPPEYQVGSVSFAVYETLHHRLQLVGARGVSRVVIDEVHEWSIILELILKRLRAA